MLNLLQQLLNVKILLLLLLIWYARIIITGRRRGRVQKMRVSKIYQNGLCVVMTGRGVADRWFDHGQCWFLICFKVGLLTKIGRTLHKIQIKVIWHVNNQ